MRDIKRGAIFRCVREKKEVHGEKDGEREEIEWEGVRERLMRYMERKTGRERGRGTERESGGKGAREREKYTHGEKYGERGVDRDRE